jgi:hypothetical protein
VSTPKIAASLYRIAKTYPPSDDEYQTALEKYGLAKPSDSPEVHWARDKWSLFDTEENARAQAIKRKRRLGGLIVRCDIPVGAGIQWKRTFSATGHYSLWGDKEELKSYLSDFVAEV